MQSTRPDSAPVLLSAPHGIFFFIKQEGLMGRITGCTTVDHMTLFHLLVCFNDDNHPNALLLPAVHGAHIKSLALI